MDDHNRVFTFEHIVVAALANINSPGLEIIFFVAFCPPYWISDLLPVICIVFQQPIKTAPGTDLVSSSPISSPEFSGASVSGGSPGRTLGTRNFYRRNRAVPVLLRMLGFDVTEVNRSHHESQLQPISAI